MAEKILVVDDEWELRNLLTEFLTGEGYDVIQASNGEEALELAEKEEPQVILLDIEMPGIDGIEVCRRLKEEDKTRFIPVIMVTALEDRDVDAFVEGADDFVTIPFSLMEFSFRVRSMLRIKHLTDDLQRSLAYIEKLKKNLPDL
ncbi:MAG: response regulator [Deltaproteobacteria bacterium]|nr:response regulator [Deltaproteobacteria bacterium]